MRNKLDSTKLINLHFVYFFLLNFKDDGEAHANAPSKVRQVREVVKVYPPDTPDLSRDLVMLDIPNKLFGQLAPDVALRSSEALGGLLQVSILC